MKKLASIAAALLMTAVCAHAQFGIIGGLTSSSTDLQTAVADVNSVNQYHIGVAYKFALGNLIAIQPAVVYNVKGTSIGDIRGIGNIISTNYSYETGYIEIPVQLQVGFGLGPLFRVFAIAEPFAGYAVSNKVEFKAGSVSDVKNTWDNLSSRLEYGAGIGAGVEVLKHLQVSVRYFWNLGDMFGNKISIGNIVQEVASQKCNGIVASAAIFF